jgi:hypothetical protein
MNNEVLTLDPRAAKVQTIVKIVGTGAVVAITSTALIVTGASLVMASVIAIAGLFMVNFAVPVAARAIALWKQKSLTALTEAFSEETIREDEVKEGERIRTLEQEYITSRSELEGAQEELEKQIKNATPEEKEMLKQQVNALQSVINDAEDTLKTRKSDFAELQRVNKLYIALHRSASAMSKAQGAERNSEEIQRLETARNSIKTKMRAAMAGKTIDAMKVKKSDNPLDVLGTRVVS